MTKEHEKFIKEMQNIADSEIRESDAAIAKEKGRIQEISFMMETMEEYFKKSEPDVVHHIKAQEPKKKVIIIDNGKIKALRDAGWSYEKIADEVGCSPQTVANRLYAMTQKEKAKEKAEDK